MARFDLGRGDGIRKKLLQDVHRALESQGAEMLPTRFTVGASHPVHFLLPRSVHSLWSISPIAGNLNAPCLYVPSRQPPR